MPTSRPTSRTTISGVSRWDFTPLSSLTASTQQRVAPVLLAMSRFFGTVG